MKILLAADGSKFTKKALGFLATHESLVGPEGEVCVLNVQMEVPTRVKHILGAADIAAYYREESDKVLEPIKRFLARHAFTYRCVSVTGSAAAEIVRVAGREHSQLIVMGAHWRGLIGRALMGSVAQRVVADSDVPVLLVK